MARRARNRLTALAIGIGSIVTGRLAGAHEAEPFTIGVLVVNEAGAAPDVLTVARAEAARIYHALGIALIWVDADEKGRDYHFVVKITPHAIKGKGIDSRAMGVAAGTTEIRGTLAYVFHARIQNLTRRIGADPGVILGHVIAHELGHLLLPYNAHAKSGLMRGSWDTDQAMRAMRGALTFTAREAALIRQRLGAQNWLAIR